MSDDCIKKHVLPGSNAIIAEYCIGVSAHRSASGTPVSPLRCATKALHLIGPFEILMQIWCQQSSSRKEMAPLSLAIDLAF